MSAYEANYGVIAEYNPFHNGHAYHIAQTRSMGASHIVAVMSGHFVQRGEPAAVDKWTRARCALENGVDLVLELPLPWAMAPAEKFARGAVSLFNALGCVGALSFGSESGDTAALFQCAQAVRHPCLSSSLKRRLATGKSFAAARESAVRELFGGSAAAVLTHPNDILGVEYCKALLDTHSSIHPCAIRREGAAHDGSETMGPMASASHLRASGLSSSFLTQYVPSSAAALLEEQKGMGYAPVRLSHLEGAILYRLRTMSLAEMAALPDISEGLENRLFSAARQAADLNQLYTLVKTKRYSHARIRRIVLSALLGLTKDDSEGFPPYLRVLGLNDKGRELLREAKTTAGLPLLMRPAQLTGLSDRARHIFALECRATDIFSLASPTLRPCGLDYTKQVLLCD